MASGHRHFVRFANIKNGVKKGGRMDIMDKVIDILKDILSTIAGMQKAMEGQQKIISLLKERLDKIERGTK